MSGASEYVRIGIPSAHPVDQTVGSPAFVSGHESRSRNTVVASVIGAIGLGVIVLVAGRLLIDDEATAVSDRLMIGTLLISALYIAVSVIVWRLLAAGRVRPHIATGGDDTRAIAIGFAVGLGGAVVIVGVNSLVAGGLASDPNIVAILYERQWLHVAVLLVLTIIAAPLVEEILFRGLLVESFRAKGRGSAVLVGAIAFSVWHLEPAQLRYYILMGFFLGFLYWRFGLNGAVTAHAVFNATLVVFAFAVISGAPQTATTEGLTVDLPPGWTVVEDDFGADFLVDLAVEAPTGAGFVVQARDGFERRLGRDDLSPIAEGIGDVEIGGQPGYRFVLPSDFGPAGEVYAVQHGSRVYTLTFISMGSARSEAEFPGILASLRFQPG